MTSPSTKPAAAAQPFTGKAEIQGRFVWHELLARDAEKAVAFYPPVTGWTVQRVPMPGAPVPYIMFARDGQGLAGIQPYPAEAAGAPAVWLPYMATTDADATVRKVTSLGGAVLMPPTTIPTVGRIAVLRDPQGAQFAVIQPEPAATPEVMPGVGEFAWHEMLADDPAASLEFYRTLFGWELKHAMDMGEHGIYQMFGRGEFVYGGFMRRSPETPGCMWNCYVRVADLDASVATVKASGGKIVMGPHEVPNDDRVVIAVDNQGTVVSLVGKIRR